MVVVTGCVMVLDLIYVCWILTEEVVIDFRPFAASSDRCQDLAYWCRCGLLWCVDLIWNVVGFGLVLSRWMLELVVALDKIGDVLGYPKWWRAYPKIVLC